MSALWIGTVRCTRMLLLLCCFASFGAGAHHSRATFFDMSRTVEVEGEITRVQWRHPHVRYWVQADPAYGGAEWELETTPPSLLERQGIDPDILTAGTRVRVAGPPSKFAANTMEVSHVLLPDGREVLLHRDRPPRWTDNAVHRDQQEPIDEEAVRAAEAAANGVFRVWNRQRIPNDDRAPFWLDEYPLTELAAAVAAQWDPVTGIEVGCRGKDMPWIMASNWPFELIDEGASIRLLAEEFDRVRIIHLDASTAEITPSPMGYSVGHWDEGDLVVTTTHINSRQFGSVGIPLSDDVEIHERFVLSADERRLDYEMTVTDPATFTEPVTMTGYWRWHPGEAVKPYNCIETPGSWTTLDRSEFTPER